MGIFGREPLPQVQTRCRVGVHFMKGASVRCTGLLLAVGFPIRPSSRFWRGEITTALQQQQTSIESPQMWVWPQLPFGGSPHPAMAIGGPFPQAPAFPSPPSASLFPPPPWLFFRYCGRRRPRLVWGEGFKGARGVEGEGPPSGTWGQTHIWGYSTQGIPDIPPFRLIELNELGRLGSAEFA